MTEAHRYVEWSPAEPVGETINTEGSLLGGQALFDVALAVCLSSVDQTDD